MSDFTTNTDRHILYVGIVAETLKEQLMLTGCSLLRSAKETTILLPDGAVEGTTTETRVYYRNMLKSKRVETLFVGGKEGKMILWTLITCSPTEEIGTRTIEINCY